MLAARFDLGAHAFSSKARLLDRLESIVRGRHARQEITALVIDEAQALPVEILEEIRLLANLETTTEKLLPVVLAGQPALADRLNEAGLRQLKQRVALRCELHALDLQDTAAYIAARIRTAGGDPADVFTQQAVTLIHEYPCGLPRTINVMCDNALLSGFALDCRPVDGRIVLEACKDFDLREPARHAPLKSPPPVLVTPSHFEPEREPVAVPGAAPRAEFPG